MKTRLAIIILGATLSTTTLAEHHNQNVQKAPPEMGFFGTLKVMREMLFSDLRRPSKKLPEVKPDFQAFLAPADHAKFIWFGHSSLLMNVDGQTIFVDPVFDSASPFDFLIKRFQAPVVPLEDVPEVHTIVISHDHYDHLDKSTVKFYRNKATRFVVPTGVGQHLLDWGIEASRITELTWHESITLGDVTFRATPAQHFSGRGLFDRNETLWASWIIQGKTDKIYYSGDSGYGPHFKEIGDQYGPFDYAFLENGQYNVGWPDIHMQPEETVQAYLDLKAETLIPVHWGMYDLSLHHWTEPVARTHAIATNWNIPIVTPKIGETVDFFHHPNTAWWEPFLPELKVEKASHENAPARPAVYVESYGHR